MGDWFLSSVVQRKRLNDPLSDKETYHVVLDLKDSAIRYEVGDCLKVLPENSQETVDQILQILGFSGSEAVCDREGLEITLESFLLTKADLHKVTKKLFTAIAHSGGQEEAHPLLRPENKNALKEHLEKTDLLTELTRTRPTMAAEQLSSLLLPLMPRYYSVASSMRVVKEEAHLTIAAIGVASDYLCKGVDLFDKKIRVEHHKSPHFGLPKDAFDKPIIMVGPGTGIAPFRGFLQERVELAACKENWLFFGERRSLHDFYYREEWEKWQQEGFLQLDTAFSRDDEKKIYVQHRMYEKRKEVWEWINVKGAYLFVCGDKDRMAKSVEETLLQIFCEEGGMLLPEARLYLQKMRDSRRYLRDVY